ncbi:MAG: FkbM family methyltransferase, partial [Hyphomonadaceae bacterium]|nr:FkbM family methyltransferase [Hyphomonadaceae bacterium]
PCRNRRAGMAPSLSAVFQKLASLRLVDSRRLHLLPEQTQLKRLLAHFDVDCVFDVGANTGQYATMLRRKAGFKGRIISFEPIPEAAANIRKKAKDDPLWTVEELALADTSESRLFHVMAGSEFSSLSAPRNDEVGRFAAMNRPARSIMVQTETLASVFPRLQTEHGFKRPFLKMDTQGFDLSVLRGAGSILSNFIGFQSELSIRRIYQDATDFREAITFYQSLGFDLSAFVPNNAGHFPALIEIDCIMVRRDLMADALQLGGTSGAGAPSSATAAPHAGASLEQVRATASVELPPRKHSVFEPNTSS